MTVKELAERSGIFHGTLLRYLNNHREIPVPALYEVAAALEVEPRALVARAEARLAAEKGTPSTSTLRFDEASDVQASPAEVGRRISMLVGVLARGRGSKYGYREISPRLLERGVRFGVDEWARLLEGHATTTPDVNTLEVIADVLGTEPAYLLGAAGDPDVVRIDSQLEFLRALQSGQVEGIAARTTSDVTPETLRAITAHLKHEG
jgi:transcriptional regulator with XRE-family HTH domain